MSFEETSISIQQFRNEFICVTHFCPTKGMETKFKTLLLVFRKERPYLVLDLNLISNLHVTRWITLVNWWITLVNQWITLVNQWFTSCKLPVYNCKLLKGASTSLLP